MKTNYNGLKKKVVSGPLRIESINNYYRTIPINKIARTRLCMLKVNKVSMSQ